MIKEILGKYDECIDDFAVGGFCRRFTKNPREILGLGEKVGLGNKEKAEIP